MNETTSSPSPSIQKYHQAAWGFLAMNLLYVLVTFLKLPPLGLNVLEIIGYTVVALALFGTCSYFIYRGGRKLTLFLAILYAIRSCFSIYTIAMGTAFPLVPWVLPTMIVAFYFLGRAVWDWP